MQAGYSFSFLEHLPERFSLQEVVEHNINSGNEYRPVFEDCLHHGLFMNFFSDGRTRDSGYYKNGLKDGIWLHRDGQDNTCLVGVYRNGLRQGEWKQYNAAGKFIAVIIYNKDGVESWRKKLRN
jgi:antitoxin component YwqK of YwqJK toxin-antitoxin module